MVQAAGHGQGGTVAELGASDSHALAGGWGGCSDDGRRVHGRWIIYAFRQHERYGPRIIGIDCVTGVQLGVVVVRVGCEPNLGIEFCLDDRFGCSG
jgi:hypothetical protein